MLYAIKILISAGIIVAVTEVAKVNATPVFGFTGAAQPWLFVLAIIGGSANCHAAVLRSDNVLAATLWNSALSVLV